nr:hypothetical protein [Rhizobium cauense]
MRATMPLSPQEVRAQKDMVRALYAAENAKTTQDLVREREKSLSLQLKHDTLALDAGRFAAEISGLQAQISDMSVEAAELRSRLRKDENYISQLKTSLHIAEQASAGKEGELETLRTRLNKLAAQADGLKVDLAARETEIESMSFAAKAVRTERDNFRQDVSLLRKRAKDAEQQLAQHEHAVIRLEDQAERDATSASEKDTLLARRQQEITKLKEQVKAANAELRKANRALRNAGLPSVDADAVSEERVTGETMATELDTAAVAARLSEEVRKRSAAVSEQLLKAKADASQDGAVREEIAGIAARMVALTAINEGPSSPIRDLLPDANEPQDGERINLAQRAATILSEPG